ncbi:MAG: hypothetical protein KJ731_02830 [Alphaproteobacteria bacterium]|nr:hypothetical protein [Alphaproteobacteria bacterium]MBU1280069.1 hypothetical protein [Alphaproteobacteria bacterium]MBU1827401.1 hypothetical protein [Alphaproteobacteria bacterium]MBU2241484.1 hypothetical protein [Alphaproteobacteria bacterium]
MAKAAEVPTMNGFRPESTLGKRISVLVVSAYLTVWAPVELFTLICGVMLKHGRGAHGL